MTDTHRSRRQLWGLGQLLLLGALVGLACWPLNLVDRWQDELLAHLPRFRGEPWNLHGLLIATAPLLVVPLLLWLQRGWLAAGAGSGIPQTIASLEQPATAEELLGLKPTLARLSLWTAASLALLPLGREGPVVHVGAAVAQALGQRHRLEQAAPKAALLAVGAGAGLAGGFNSPLMGALFVMEELTGRFSTGLIWPALVACSAAALVSNLAGIPLFPLGMVPTEVAEWNQLLWAVPMGLGGGLLGGLFARWLLISGRWLGLRVMRRPTRWGLLLGAGLALLALLSGGGSGGDGEALMQQLLAQGRSLPVPGSPLSIAGWLLLLLSRIVAPVLALAAGIPGGLIDPAFTIGALFGAGSLELLGGDSQLGVALGMAAGLAGATQLPLMTLVFALRMAGDQQWLFGILLSAVLGAYAGRRLQPAPIYQALAGILLEQRQALRAGLERVPMASSATPTSPTET
jgi:H+/Cl- antiporter ClcA